MIECWRTIFIVALLLTTRGIVVAQEVMQIDRIELDEGIQLGHVFDVFQDNLDYIIVSTNKGLFRYDGRIIEAIDLRTPDSIDLNQAWVFCAMQALDSTYYIGTSKGLLVLDKWMKPKSFLSHESGNIHSLPHAMVKDVYEDGQGNIWIGTVSGVSFLNTETREINQIALQSFSGHRHGPKFFEYPKNVLWATSERGVYRINMVTYESDLILPQQSDDYSADALRYNYLAPLNDSICWISSHDGLWQLNIQNQSLIRKKDLDDVIGTRLSSIINISDSRLGIGSFDKGLFVYDISKSKIVRQVNRKSSERYTLSSNSIYTFLEDNRKNLWIGTFSGLNRFHFQDLEPKLIRNIDEAEHSANYILKSWGDNAGGLWTNTLDGFFYRPDIGEPAQRLKGSEFPTSGYRGIDGFYINDNSELFFTVRTRGLFKYNFVTNTTAPISAFNTCKNSDRYLSLTGGSSGSSKIYCVSDCGIFEYNFKTNDHQWLRVDTLNFDHNDLIVGIQTFKDNDFLAHTKSGLFIRDPEDSSALVFHPMKNLTSNPTEVRDVICHNDSIFILFEKSLCILNKQLELVANFDQNHGIANEPILNMQVDEDGGIWFIQNGVVFYDRKNHKSTKIPVPAHHEGYLRNAKTVLTSGHVIFANVSGCVVIHPDSISQNGPYPVLRFKSIEINRESEVLPDENWENDGFSFSFDDKVLTFEFSGIDFRYNSSLKYFVKLSGYEGEWKSIGSTNQVTYSNLEHGHYKLQVKAVNVYDQTTKHQLEVPFEIIPPYWKMTWFQLLVWSIGITILFMVYKYYGYTRRLKQEKLVADQKNKYKSIFLANMSHEIRTPMNAISGMSDLLQKTSLSSVQKDYVENISNASKNLLVIINDILDYSKIESGKYVLVKRPFNIEKLVRQIEPLFTVEANNKNIDFIVNLDKNVPKDVLGDEARVNQILINLLSNAFKFTNEGFVRLTIQAVQNEENKCHIKFEIQDSGIGISKNEYQRIFKSFERIEKTDGDMKVGTGLGLAIVNQLVTLQKGTIKVSSKLGEGSTFFVTLPFELPDLLPDTTNTLVPVQSIHREGVNFLVVDDKKINQLIVQELIKDEYKMAHIHQAENGRQAVEIVKSEPIDLVLMDVRMPVMGGIEATRKIRLLSNEADINPIIIGLTANAIDHQIQECLDAGMQSCITKPIDKEVFYKTLNQFIAK